MGTISKIIPDLGNGLSGFKGVFDKISEETVFAASKREYEGIIQPVDYRYFSDQQEIISFETQFSEVIT